MSKKIKMIFCIMLIILILLPISSTFAATQVECKPGTIPWVNITVSNSYQVCRDMASNIGNSSILESHLTTNKDYNAVAMLSASVYGYGVSNTGGTVYIKDDGTIGNSENRQYYSTTGNASGVMDLGTDPYLNTLKTMSTVTGVYCQTASLLSESKSTADSRRTNLITAINNEATKKYVDEIYSGYTTYSGNWRTPIYTGENGRENSANKGMGIWTEETLGQTCYWGNSTYGWLSSYPVAIRTGLFSFNVGSSSWETTGGASSYATFRPVIWNS
jgi:hypothetical protein